MITVYRAENIIDANLVKGLLEAQGIMAFINGGYLQGGIGELPVANLISVAVADDDAPAATDVVTEYQHRLETPSGKGETRWDVNSPLLDWDD